MEMADFRAVITTLMAGATGGAEYAHISGTPDITFTVIYKCISFTIYILQ